MRRPWRAAISSIASGMIEPDEISTTPRPGPPIAPTNASNSEISLIVEGIGTPPQPEWFSEYEAPMLGILRTIRERMPECNPPTWQGSRISGGATS
jgi:hypothetical protein